MEILEIFENGTMAWYKDNKLNRDDDLPAIIDNTGSIEWYKNGKVHRDRDMSAIILRTGSMIWYKNGVRVRNYIDILNGNEIYSY